MTLYFQQRDYEVIACREPVRCPVYDDGAPCSQSRPCGDLMITDICMPRMTGLEMLEAQKRQGCKLDIRNKAVLSGSIDQAAFEAIQRLGCASFLKPFRLAQLEKWVLECELRMDLSRPLGFRRREAREACSSRALVAVGSAGDVCTAEVVNRSGSGLCLRVDRPLAVTQVLDLRGRAADAEARFEVRWLRPEAGSGFLAGVSCC
jgi:CheY-like chemotaxis protein